MGFMDLFKKAQDKMQDPEVQAKLKAAAQAQMQKRQAGQRGPSPVTPAPYYGGSSSTGSMYPYGQVSGDLDGDGVPDFLQQGGVSGDYDGDGVPDSQSPYDSSQQFDDSTQYNQPDNQDTWSGGDFSQDNVPDPYDTSDTPDYTDSGTNDYGSNDSFGGDSGGDSFSGGSDY